MSVVELTKHGRRVLGHLPVWAEDEDAHVAAETEANGGSERAYNLSAFAERLAEDPEIAVTSTKRSMTEAETQVSLDGLVADGLAELTPEGYRMTQLGYESIVAPVEDLEQVPGAVTVKMHPVVAKLAPTAEVAS